MRLVILTAILGFVVAFYCVSHSRPVRNLLNVKVVRIDPISGVEIRPALADGAGETFQQMMDRLRPYAAINGTFYDKGMKPLGDVLIDGKLVNRGRYRNAIAFTRDGKVDFLRRTRGRLRWSGYTAGLAAGPRLVHNGRISLDPVADGFSRRTSVIRAPRSGVGRTKNGQLLLVVAKESITLQDFAKLMLDLGAVEAMNLDGGGACGLYHNGKTLASPPLPMTNVLVVYKRS